MSSNTWQGNPYTEPATASKPSNLWNITSAMKPLANKSQSSEDSPKKESNTSKPKPKQTTTKDSEAKAKKRTYNKDNLAPKQKTVKNDKEVVPPKKPEPNKKLFLNKDESNTKQPKIDPWQNIANWLFKGAPIGPLY